jgi:hypothetical protein
MGIVAVGRGGAAGFGKAGNETTTDPGSARRRWSFKSVVAVVAVV